MSLEEPAWKDLDPLLSETYRDPKAAWATLLRQERMLNSAINKACYGKRWSGARLDVKDLAQQTLVGLMTKIVAKRGLTRPPDWEDRPTGAGSWFYRVVFNMAIQQLRNQPDRRVRGKSDSMDTARDPDGPAPSNDVRLSITTSPEEVIELKSALARRKKALEQAGLPPLWALAHSLLHEPDLVDREMISRAANTVARGAADTGLARSVEQTELLVVAWHQQHGERAETTESRRMLAWILRSTDDAGPDAWRLRAPDEMMQALDLLRKWDGRARDRLREQENEEKWS